MKKVRCEQSKKPVEVSVQFPRFPKNFHQNVESDDAMLKAKYSELSENIERMSALIHVVFIKFIVPVLIVPAMLISLVNYYMFDMGDESFDLACPVMYVNFIGKIHI